MKRIGRILSLIAIVVVLSASASFAAGLTLEDSFPQEGNSNLNPQNVAVKLIFSEKITSLSTIDKNKHNFAIVDEEGNAMDFTPMYNEEKYPNEVWLQINSILEQNTKYKVTIYEGMVSDNGNTTDENIELTFATRDTEKDSKGYMMLMFVMIGGMMVFTVIETRRKDKKESTQKKPDEKVNPYKEARRTGKSVEDIVAKTEKQKQQAAKKRQRLEKKEADDQEDERQSRPGFKPVKSKKTFNDLGYKTPQSLINQRKAREQAQAEKKKKQQVKRKGGKQQGRKK